MRCFCTRQGLRTRLVRLPAALALSMSLALPLSGCGAVAFPCRLASSVIKIVPVVGHAAAVPTDACAEVIDP